jgi:outer membrane immunogenic protein
MRNVFLGAVGLVAVGLAAPACAADLAVQPYARGPAPVALPYYDWTGFYIGANGGWGSERDHRQQDDLGVNLGSFRANGGVAGGQLGYRWQISPVVFGFEAQGDWADLRGSTQNLSDPLSQIGSRVDAFGLFTGQIGYAWNNVLLYGKGGAALVDRRFDFISNATGLVTATSGYATRLGGTAGVGLEVGFAPNWSVGVEYDHVFALSRRSVAFTATGLGTAAAGTPVAGTFTSGGDMDLATVRVNYRWGGPALSRY